MAQVDIGKIKIVWKGAWNSSTAYTVDDAVSHSGNSYICIQAGTNQNPSSATAYWSIMASAGTNGTDADLLNIASTAQGDIYYNNGSAIARLAPGTANQALLTGGAGANPSWGTISSGEYSVHKIDSYNYNTGVGSGGSTTNYVDIAGGNSLNFTPTSTNDRIFIAHYLSFHWGDANGGDAYIMMKAGASTIGSGDIKLNYGGNHTTYVAGASDNYDTISKSFILPCTNLTVGTTYYIEQAGASHSTGTNDYNSSAGGASAYISGLNKHHVTLIHYKKN